METTLIQVKKETAEKLKNFKEFSRQSYDDVIRKLITDVEAEVLTAQEIKEIEEGLADVRAGRVYSIEQVAKELGVRLKG